MHTTIKQFAAGLLLLLASQCTLAQTESFLDARDRIEWDVGGLYDGRFSDGTPFQIQLAYPQPASVLKEAPEFSTGYWYPRHYTGQRIALIARPFRTGTITLEQFADDRKQVERFSIALSPDRLGGTGTWTSPALRKQLSFELHRVVLYKQLVVKRPPPPKEPGDQSEPRPFQFSATFPVLQDAGVKDWIRKMLDSCDATTECANSVMVDWTSPDLLSLDASNYTYSQMAAHGNTGTAMQHYRRLNGRLVPVHFDAFLDSSAACRSKVSSAIVARLAAQGLSEAKAGGLDEHRDPKFLALPGGLEFHFDQYEVGSYAEGMPSVFLSRATLGSCVRNLPDA